MPKNTKKKSAVAPKKKKKQPAAVPRSCGRKQAGAAALPRNKGGRPSSYSEKMAERICRGLAAGKSLGKICRETGMPERQTVYGWFAPHPEFFDAFLRAREAGTHALADEILDIADDASNDWIETETAKGQPVTKLNDEAIARAKIRIHARLQLMARLNPGRFGDKVDIKHSGKVEGGVTIDEGTRLALIERRKKALQGEQAAPEAPAAGNEGTTAPVEAEHPAR